jgi:hypothetical protein
VKDPKKTPTSFAPSLDRRKRDPAVISPLRPTTAAMGLRTRRMALIGGDVQRGNIWVSVDRQRQDR